MQPTALGKRVSALVRQSDKMVNVIHEKFLIT